MDQISGLYQAQSAGFIGVGFQPVVTPGAAGPPRLLIEQILSPAARVVDLIGESPAGNRESGGADHRAKFAVRMEYQKMQPLLVVFPKIPDVLG